MSRERRQQLAFAFIASVSLYAAIVSTKTQSDVRRIEPKVTQVIRATAACRAEALMDAESKRACAKRIRIGLSACRHDQDCRLAFLALVRAAETEEVVPGGNNPSGLGPGSGATPGPEDQPNPVSPGPDLTKPITPIVDGAKDTAADALEDVGACDAAAVLEGVCQAVR